MKMAILNPGWFPAAVSGLCVLFSACVGSMPNLSTTEEQIANGQIQFVGGDGSSIEKAVVIKGAKNEEDGVEAEEIFITQKFGRKGIDWKFTGSSLVKERRKHFDVMAIVLLASNAKAAIIFDISSFFGKD